jgi:hypothetical protein
MTTENQTQDQAPAPTGRAAIVTIEDVRATLDNLQLDARKTNASVIQRALGRGGMGTVQKHLDTIRAELDQPVPVLDGEIPPTPKEVADAVWRAAYSATQNLGLAALSTALLERDDARMKLERALGDVAVWQIAKDEADLAAQISESNAIEANKDAMEATAAMESLKIALEASEAGRVADAKAAEDRFVNAILEASVKLREVKAAHEVEMSHAETKIVTLQATIDRLVNQLSDVKSLLPRVVAEETAKGE